MTNPERTIVVVTPYFPPYGGGLERYAHEIASRLHKDYKWRVVVITSGTQRGVDEQQEMGALTVYRLSYRWKFSNTPFSFGWFRKIRRILSQEKPDILNIHAPVPGLGDIASMVGGKRPQVITYHTGSMHKGRALPDFFIWLYENIFLRILLRRANHIICSSDFVRLNFLRKYEFKSSTLTPGVLNEVFRPAPEHKSTHPSIIFVAGLGRAEQYKGLSTLLESVAILKKTIPDVQLIVIGDGDMRPEYEQAARQRGIETAIVFRGRLAGVELTRAYQEGHVFALPSSNDSSPMTIIEAMSSGLPVVSTNIGGIPALVKDGENGFLIVPGNAIVLAEKLALILLDTKLAEKIGHINRAKAINGFSWESRIAEYDDILKENLVLQPSVKVLETPVRYFPYIGGVEYQVLYLSEQLLKLGYSVEVLCANEPLRNNEEVIDGVLVKRLKYLFKIANTNITLGLPFALWRSRFDIAHTYLPTPWAADWTVLIAKLRNKPVVLTIQNDLDKPDIIGKIVTWIYLHTLFQITLKLADKVVIVNPDWKKTFKKTAHLFEQIPEKVIVAPNAVDINLFKPSENKYRKNSILFVSVLDEYHRFKGFDYLLDALPEVKMKIPDAKLVVVGEGVLVDEYRNKALRLGVGDMVEFHGKKTQAELVSYYQDANVFILPSTEIEGFAIVLLEAMASGVPVIATDVHGVAIEVKERETGIIIPAKNASSIANALLEILASDGSRTRMGNKGRQLIVEKYSWQAVALTLSKLFKGLLK